MLRFESKDTLDEGREIVQLWALADEARCLLAMLGDGLELRLVEGTRILQRAPYESFKQARDASRAWRIEYEIAREARRGRPDVSCPECGEDAWRFAATSTALPPLTCRSCGHAWIPAAGGNGNGQRR